MGESRDSSQMARLSSSCSLMHLYFGACRLYTYVSSLFPGPPLATNCLQTSMKGFGMLFTRGQKDFMLCCTRIMLLINEVVVCLCEPWEMLHGHEEKSLVKSSGLDI